MNGLRHVLVVVASSLPLLFFSLWAAGRGGGRAVAAAALLWAAGVCLLAFAVWRETVRPHADLLAELDGTTAHAARWRARELKENLERCRDETLSLQELFEDLHRRYPSEETEKGFEPYVYSAVTERLKDYYEERAKGGWHNGWISQEGSSESASCPRVLRDPGDPGLRQPGCALRR